MTRESQAKIMTVKVAIKKVSKILIKLRMDAQYLTKYYLKS